MRSDDDEDDDRMLTVLSQSELSFKFANCLFATMMMRSVITATLLKQTTRYNNYICSDWMQVYKSFENCFVDSIHSR